MDEIDADTDRDKYLSAAEAKTYGIIDEVVEPKKTPSGGLKPVEDKAS
jgi:ATP-dependent Clp protease protease subunit